MWQRIQDEVEEKASMQEYHNTVSSEWQDTCFECGCRLNSEGNCPICDDGEEDYYSLYEWIDGNGNKLNIPNNNSSNTGASTVVNNMSNVANTKNIVTIVYDTSKHKLRAQADDGVHGLANVAFPNDLRTREGQQYKVDTLTWNGKNYRVSGDIKPI